MEQIINAHFNGIPCDADFAITLGASPGHGTITFADTSIILPKIGRLILSDNINMVSIKVYVDKPRLVSNAERGYDLSATIYDRRFTWKWGGIVGRYNFEYVTGIPKQEVTLENLIRMCFEALNEKIYSLIDIPFAYPEVSWEYENPGNALEDLCQRFGLVIGMDATPNNRIVICPYNYARKYPTLDCIEDTTGISDGILPKNVILVGKRKIMQREFTSLIPVGEEIDGTIKSITDLSYAPSSGAGGWGRELVAMFSNLTVDQRELALKCIYKWYMIDWTKYDSDKILPLLSGLATTRMVEGRLEHDKPYVIGPKTVWDGVSFKTENLTRIDDGFSIDTSLGIVKFSELKNVPGADGFASDGFTVPDLSLAAAYELKDNLLTDFTYCKMPIKNGTELDVIYHDNSFVSYNVYNTSTGKFVETNTSELVQFLKQIMPKLVEKHQIGRPTIKLYPGIVRIGAYGMFTTVSWRANATSGAETEIQKEIEIPQPALPSFEEKLAKRHTQTLWESFKRIAKVQR